MIDSYREAEWFMLSGEVSELRLIVEIGDGSTLHEPYRGMTDFHFVISIFIINKLSILEVVELRARDGGRTTVSEWDTGNQSIRLLLMQ